MWIYYLLIIIIFIINNLKKIKRRDKIIISVFLMFILAALRSYNIGNDTLRYYRLYESINNLSLKKAIMIYSNRYEIGFIILNRIVGIFNKNAAFFVFVVSVFEFYVIGFSVKKISKNPFMSLFTFITLRYYFFYYSNLRQGIALSIVSISYYFLIKNKKNISMLLVVLASFFHSSAYIALLPVIFIKLNLKNKRVYYLVVISILIFIMWDKIILWFWKYIPLKYVSYFNTDYYTDANNLANMINFALNSAIVIIVLWLTKNSDFRTTKEINILKMRYCISLLSVFFSLLTLKFSTLSRLQYYFSLFLIYSLPNAIKDANIHFANKRVLKLFIYLSFLFYHTVILIYRPEWQHVYPYEIFLGVK